MNLLFILSWNRDIVIKPAGSFNEVKELKNRLNNSELDFIYYSSGFFTPFKLDAWQPEITEEDIIELGGNQHARRPYFDRIEIEPQRKNYDTEDI